MSTTHALFDRSGERIEAAAVGRTSPGRQILVGHPSRPYVST
jgi:hypothetical protein